MAGEITALMSQGKYAEAIALCEAALQVNPVAARVHALMGESYFQQKDVERAEPCFRKAYILEPKLLDAGIRQAQCLERMRRYREAMDLIKELVRLKPNDNTVMGLYEFLQTKHEAVEHDGWERSRRIDATVLHAGHGRQDPLSVPAVAKAAADEAAERLRQPAPGNPLQGRKILDNNGGKA